MTVSSLTNRIQESFYGDTEGFFNAAGATSSLVPHSFHCALNGVPFMLDHSARFSGFTPKAIGPASIPIAAQQQDQQNEPGAASLNRQSGWRHVISDWSGGTGQTWRNEPKSDESMFRSSKGINPWTVGQLSLHYGAVAAATVTTPLQAWGVGVGTATRRYYINGSDSKMYESANASGGGAGLTSFASKVTGVFLTASPGGTYHAGCTDGVGSYVVTGSGTTITGVTQYLVGGSTSTFVSAPPAGVARFLCYAKGRLLLGTSEGSTGKIYDCSTGTPSTAIVLQNTGEFLVCAAGAGDFLYIATASAKTSTIYAATVDADSTSITLGTIAANLPNGEIVLELFGYAGLLFIGTNLGFRVATPSATGSLTVGSLVPITGGVYCFAAYGQFVWFGWSNYDTTSSGLGRIDPTTFTDAAGLIPAYASDLMGATTGTVTGCLATLDEYNMTTNLIPQAFVNSGTSYLYAADATTLVSSGTLNTGFTTFGISDQKVAFAAEVRTEALNGTVAVAIRNIHGGSAASVDTFNASGSYGVKMPVQNISGSEHELVLTLTPTGAVSPIVTATTLFINPAPERGEYFTLPLLIGDKVKDLRGKDWIFDPWLILSQIRSWASPATTPVILQLGYETYSVFIDDYETHSHHEIHAGRFQATCLVNAKNLVPLTAT